MSDFTKGLFTGFFEQATEDDMAKKEAARKFFERSMTTAQRYAQSGGANLKASAQKAKATIAQLKGAGVPDPLLAQIAGRDPEQLERYYTEIADLQAGGTKIPPEAFEGILQVAKENKEDPVELTSRIKPQLKRNLEADPQSFRADPIGAIWATVMGYDAMEQAQSRLDSTMIGDRSASEWLTSGEDAPIEYDVGPDPDWNKVGDLAREADLANKVAQKEALAGDGGERYDPKDLLAVRKAYDDMVKANYDKIYSSIPDDQVNVVGSEQIMVAAQAQARADLATQGFTEDEISRATGAAEGEGPAGAVEGTVETTDEVLEAPPTPKANRPVGERRRSPVTGDIVTWTGTGWRAE